MADQVSSDHVPSTNDERIPPPSSEEVLVISESGHVNDDDHVGTPKTRQEKTEKDNIVEGSSGLQDVVSLSSWLPCKEVTSSSSTTSCEASEDNGRERLKRHRIEMAGRVWIPDIWGQEDLLKDWIDCSTFDACLVPKGIMSARAALAEEGRRATSGGLRIENRC
ncbi:hypothetical protein TIFTF001_008714 [Ficus carica]|uniref:Protein BIC1 n=1 Tax=Ficus carica TaxID=3494 RepID=A0AA88A5E5_FICCA|nr:hypothetical protein TIFTF001_008714 [Ficus carica]